MRSRGSRPVFSPQETPSGRRRSAFTLIELLVVIAIVGILLAILLPSLARARMLAQQTICMSNMRQIVTASIVYAQDSKDQIWPADDWADVGNHTTGFVPGLLFNYVNYADFVVECPTNKRASSSGTGRGVNGFGHNRDLNFDYTMLDETQGAQLGREIMCGYIRPNDNPMPQLLPRLMPTFTRFRSLPIFIEESTPIYNQQYTDGWWGNADQVTVRHDKGGHMGFIDGTVDLFRQSSGPSPDVQEPQDFEANDLYVSTKGIAGSWWKISDRYQPYGWVNSPRF